MKNIFSRIFQGDPVIWFIFASLCTISVVEVYSAGSMLTYKHGDFWHTLISQAGMIMTGACVAWFFSRVPVRFFRIIYVFYFVSIVLLLWAMFFGMEINGGARWIRIPIVGLSVQPSEIAKGALVGTIAILLTGGQTEKGATKETFWQIMFFTLPIVALIGKENLSTAAMICVIVFLIMIVGRVATKYLVILGASAMAFIAGAMMFFYILPEDPHDKLYDNALIPQRLSTWRARIYSNDMDTSVPPEQFEITDHNRQAVHARFAFARSHGGVQLPGKSIERDHLAQADSDFIFAIIGEELGLGGTLFVLALYVFLLFRVGQIANKCKRNFPAFLVMGLAIMMVTQAMFNMLVAVGIAPVTGQTLPLISRGGSSTLITCMYFGIILSVSRFAEQNKKKSKAAVEAEPAPAFEKA